MAIGTVHDTGTIAITARAFTSTSGRGATTIGIIGIIGVIAAIGTTSG